MSSKGGHSGDEAKSYYRLDFSEKASAIQFSDLPELEVRYKKILTKEEATVIVFRVSSSKRERHGTQTLNLTKKPECISIDDFNYCFRLVRQEDNGIIFSIIKIHMAFEVPAFYLPREIMATIYAHVEPKDILSLCQTSREWQKQCKRKEFWQLYVNEINQVQYGNLLVHVARQGKTELFLLLWNLNLQDKHHFNNYLLRSMDAALGAGHSKTVATIHNLNPSWDNYRWEALWEDRTNILLDSQLRRNLERAAKFRNWDEYISLIRAARKGPLPSYEIESTSEDVLARYGDLKTILRVYSKLDKANKKNLLEEHEELPFRTLDVGNLSLIRQLDTEYDLIWGSFALDGISHKNPEVINLTLEKIGLDSLEDITPELLEEMVGSDPVTIQYPPLRQLYISNYPEDAERIIWGSYWDMPRKELLKYFDQIPDGIELAKRFIEHAEYEGSDDIAYDVREWLKKRQLSKSKK